MLLYKFGAHGSRVALTQDKTGSNLPEDGRPWKPLGSTRVDVSVGPRIGRIRATLLQRLKKTGSLSFRRANEQRRTSRISGA
jgi:hypothetical protein